jgi:hypothetical protein
LIWFSAKDIPGRKQTELTIRRFGPYHTSKELPCVDRHKGKFHFHQTS